MSARSAAVAAAAMFATVLGLAGLGAAETPSAPSTAAQSQPSVGGSPGAATPGTDPKIQRWFLLVEKSRLAFNNILFKAEQDIKSGVDTGNCSALATATKAIENHLSDLSTIPNGGAAISAAYMPPMVQFGDAATACQNGDFGTARTTLGDTGRGAILLYGQAQDTVDEILDADK